MRILLINPPYAASEPPRIPMGLLYVAAVLEEAGHEVRVLDLLVSPPLDERVREAVENFDPAFVGTTSVTMNYPVASGLLRFVKEINPSIKTIIGGPHATFCWEQIGHDESWVDFVVCGEGEITARDLVNGLDDGGDFSNIPGLAWRAGSNGEMIFNGDRELMGDLDSLPPPAMHLFPLSRYRALRMDAGLTTGRGCPFNCAFCVGPKMVGRKPRLREPGKVVDEMENLIKMGFDNIAFSDDHFAMHRKHAFAVCDAILDRGLSVDLNIFVRADSVDEEILSKMYEAGCRKILFGVESGVQSIVDTIRKKQKLEMVREKVALATSMGINVQASFILGLPGETPETIKETFEFARSLKTFFGMHILAPLPGSDIYERSEDYGITIHHRDWGRYDANRAVTSTENLPAKKLDEIAAYYDEIFDRLAKWEMKDFEQGNLSERDYKRVERRRAQAFFWKLLREDVVEDYVPQNNVLNADDALRKLSEICAESASVNTDEAYGWIKALFDTGDLQFKKGVGFVYSDSIYLKATAV